jgi:2-oxo-4-hydroxy-4-carboxy-5-ureidoimidazoline decarboxylase
MSGVLTRWNRLPAEKAAEEILACCGSTAWARELVAHRPITDDADLMSASDEIWNRLETKDWMEAFSKHPLIGERKTPSATATQAKVWSAQEQQNVETAGEDVQRALTAANSEYELRFGRVFIVCATGKSAAEMLDILRRRLGNDEATELSEAAEEQRKITNIRLKKWLAI